jgi:hypothetical protein
VKGSDSVSNIPVYLIKPDAVPSTNTSSIRGNIQGLWYATKTNDAGEYVFVDVTEGTYNLIAQKDRFHSVVSPNIQVLRASTIDLDVTLTATGDISGKVILSNGNEPSGIFVYIPGTSFMATIAADGTFVITGVPVGQYTLTFWGENIEKKTITNASVAAGASTNVGTNIALTEKVGSGIHLAVTSPELGSVFYPNSDSFTLSVNASDSTGQITKVLFEFNDRETLVLQDTEAPFSLSFNSGEFLTGSNGVENTNGKNAVIGFGTISPVKITAFNSRGETRQILADITIMSYAPCLMFNQLTNPDFYTGYDTNLRNLAGTTGLKSYEYKVIETQLSSAPAVLSEAEKQSFIDAIAYTQSSVDGSLVLSSGITPGKKYLVAARALTTSGYTQWSYDVESLHPVLFNAIFEVPTLSINSSGFVNLTTNGLADKFILEYSSGAASTTVNVVANNKAGSYQIPSFVNTAAYSLRAKTVWETFETEFSATTTTIFAVGLSNVVTGIMAAELQVHITPVSETFNASTYFTTVSGTNLAFTKSSALSTSSRLVLIGNDLTLSDSLAVISDFNHIKFSTGLPIGATVEVRNPDGTVLATGI